MNKISAYDMIRDLHDILTQMKSIADQYCDEIKALEENQLRLTEQIKSLKTKLEKTENDRQAAEEQMKINDIKAEKNLRAEQDKYAALSEQHRSIQELVNDRLVHLDFLEEDLQYMRRSCKEQQEKVDKERRELEEEQRNFREEKNNFKQEKEHFAIEKQEIYDELKRKEKEVAHIKEEVDNKDKVLQNITKKLDNATREATALRAEEKSLRDKVIRLETELKNRNDELKVVEKLLADEKRKAVQAENKLDQLKKKAEKEKNIKNEEQPDKVVLESATKDTQTAIESQQDVSASPDDESPSWERN